MGRLDGKVALITGTARGQGSAAAAIFAREGAAVVGIDLLAEENENTVARVREAGGRMVGIAPVDLADDAAAADGVRRAADAWGGLDIVYNNASQAAFAPIDQITLEQWRFTIRNELDLVFHVCRHAWRHLVERGRGAIVNTSSEVALRGLDGLPCSAHAAAKAAVLGLTRQLAVEGAPRGIRVNAVTPTISDTPAVADILSVPGAREALGQMAMLGRIGSAEDAANAALFLASDEARFVTGTNLVVDGGTTEWIRNPMSGGPPHSG